MLSTDVRRTHMFLAVLLPVAADVDRERELGYDGTFPGNATAASLRAHRADVTLVPCKYNPPKRAQPCESLDFPVIALASDLAY